MQRLQIIRGFAALTQSALFAGLVAVLAVVMPPQGYDPGTLNDPAGGLALPGSSYTPLAINAIYLGVAAALPLALLPLAAGVPYGRALVLGAAALFLGYALVGLVGDPVLVARAGRAPGAAGPSPRLQ